MWLNFWAETIIDPAEHHYRPSSVHQFPTKTANSCKINDPCKAMNFERTLTTYISSDCMQSKVRWGVPLTLYLVCQRQSTKVFTSQWSFQQIKKVILHASWRSRYIIIIYIGLQFECCCCYRQLVILEEESSSDDTCSHGEGITSDDFS